MIPDESQALFKNLEEANRLDLGSRSEGDSLPRDRVAKSQSTGFDDCIVALSTNEDKVMATKRCRNL
jgi:hypothetical protein